MVKDACIASFEPITGNEAGYAPPEVYLQAFQGLDAIDDRAGMHFTDLVSAYPDDPLVQLHARRLQEGIAAA